MRRVLTTVLLALTVGGAYAQAPLKPRPDAFPPVAVNAGSKAVSMASTVEEMASWDRYPTYETYLAMMQQWATQYPYLCTIDTIGTSVQGRLILAAHIEGERDADPDRPQFFYSSTIHGDEVTGYVMMLRLIDTLLSSYGTSQRLTDMVNSTAIFINPLSNPDGTYIRGNSSVQGAQRYNANYVDLNRNYPDPFGTAKAALQKENEAMIDYLSSHRFRLSANLHGGSEVMNYPWDSFTSYQNPHPQADWWRAVCKRFVDTRRTYNPDHFRDVNASGLIAGGNWYVIRGGRQDYVNYFHNCLEVTMEISTEKTLPGNQLPEYWRFLSPSFLNYIDEIHSLPEGVAIREVPSSNAELCVHPNPATGRIAVSGLGKDTPMVLCDLYGREVLRGRGTLDISALPQGVYVLRVGAASAKIIKK